MQCGSNVSGLRRLLPVFPVAAQLWASICIADAVAPPASSPPATTTLVQTVSGGGSTDWSSYEADTAPASISAAGMLGVSGGAITNVESIKDLSAAANSVVGGGSKTGLALSLTPARSAISPMSQQNYVGDGATPLSTHLLRLVGSTTLGYAENDTTVTSTTYHQQAASVQITGFFKDAEDPVVALYQALDGNGAAANNKFGCNPDTIINQSSTPPTKKEGSPSGTSTDPPMATPEVQAARIANWATCKANLAKLVPWNASTYSIGYATGWIKPTTGTGPQDTLGHTYFVGGQFGFLGPKDPASSSEGMLLAIAYRKSENEPVLNTLGTTKVNYQSSSIVYGKLSGGNSSLRVLFEYNSTKSTNITQSQLALKEAIGIDAQLIKNTWISFRFGKQNSITGSGKQNASLFNLSYSPAALLSN
jgi:hypothetical protein